MTKRQAISKNQNTNRKKKPAEQMIYNKLGMAFNEDGKFKNINFNIFVKYLLNNRKFIICDDKNYYMYSKKYNLWIKTDISQICKIARKILHNVEDNTWQARFKYELREILELEAKHIYSAEDDKNYINLKNGLFNLETLELEAHTHKIFSTYQLPFEYNKKAKATNFMDFIEKLTLGDKELKAVIQEIMGYILTSRVDAQKFFIFWSAGSSGKSTLCDVLIWLVGEENVSTVSLGALSDKFARSQLEGKILNLATENETKKVKTALLKQIVGGDVIQIEKKGKDPHSYRPRVKCVFAMNNLPQFCENSYGLLRRMLIIPFPAVFTDNPNPENPKEFQRIPNFQEKLKPGFAGIFNFAMEGYKRLRDNNFIFTKSKRVDEIMRSYTQKYNSVEEFVKECISESKDSKIYKKDLYEKFKDWCNENDIDNNFINIRGFLT